MDNEEILDIDGGIFNNKEDVVDNIKGAAKNVGLPDEVVENIQGEKPKKLYYAKKNCTWCCGRGQINFAPNGVHVSSRKKEPSKAFMKSVKMTRKKLARSIQRIELLTSGKCRPGRNTCVTEDNKDGKWKEENITKVLCKCVKVVEEE